MTDYRPRFATQRPPSADTVDPGDTLDNWASVTAPYRSAWDVWTRAVEGAQGKGPGVYDHEIVPAGTTLAAAAGMGGMAFSRPSSSIGAMGRPRIPISDDAMKRAFEMSAQGMPVNRIASELGVNRITLYRRLSEHGIAGSGRGGPGLARALPPELDEQLGKAYLNQVPVNKLMKDYNVDNGTIRNAAKRLQKNSEEYSGVQRLPGKDYRAAPGGIPIEGQDMGQPNRMLQMAQTGGSPYDEDAYMAGPRRARMPSDLELDAMAGQAGPFTTNSWLNSRLDGRLPPEMYLGITNYGHTGRTLDPSDIGAPSRGMFADPSRNVPQFGTPEWNAYEKMLRDNPTDTNMYTLYGPEEEVAQDAMGNPIPLADPRHPRNQRQGPALNPMLAPSYPQRR